MGYLQPTEYESFGLAPDMTDDWITVASALIDSYCRRTSLSVAEYTERVRLVAGAQYLRLSYLPLVSEPAGTLPFLSIRARYIKQRRTDYAPCQHIWNAFSLPGTWINLDPAQVDYTPNGDLTLPVSPFGLPFNEVEVSYIAGLANIPNAVKSACALIVKNAQSTAGMNIKSSRVDMLQVQYFSDQLVDSTVRTLLRPWVANKVG